ncbi:MAG: hypothetical protein HMLKMBBP_01188 [Planctomycetes bacterium]|nr:hypothetical protein [Planctomycetota bacterium]
MTTHFHAKLVLRAAALALALAAGGGAHAEEGAAKRDVVLVVAPEEFRAALAPWRAHRERQGVTTVVVAPGEPSQVIRSVWDETGRRIGAVMLVGDVERVPCAYRPVVATRKWESDTRIATDSAWGDLDGDEIPELSVGRVPADTPDEAAAYFARVIEYETSADRTDWMRRAEVIAGTGGFGPVQDLALEQITKQFLVKLVPPSAVLHATWGNPVSAWCPPPAEMADTVVERINSGSLVVAYIGHGSPNELDTLKHGREKFPIFGDSELARVEVKRGAPVFAFIACSTGRFDSPRDCLAEDLLRRPKGPVAVIASSRVSTPYGNGILSKELLEGVYGARAATAGELMLRMKRRLVIPAAEASADPHRKDIERLAAAFYDPSEEVRAADRLEHVALYNLLGDPTLAIRRPSEFAIDAPATTEPGAKLVVTGRLPLPAAVRFELARRRDTPVRLGSRKVADEWRKTFRAANAQEVAARTEDLPAGPFRVELDVPADAAPGAYEVRVWTDGAAGGRSLEVRAAAAK